MGLCGTRGQQDETSSEESQRPRAKTESGFSPFDLDSLSTPQHSQGVPQLYNALCVSQNFLTLSHVCLFFAWNVHQFFEGFPLTLARRRVSPSR